VLLRGWFLVKKADSGRAKESSSQSHLPSATKKSCICHVDPRHALERLAAGNYHSPIIMHTRYLFSTWTNCCVLTGCLFLWHASALYRKRVIFLYIYFYII
jgi:hypothetical protein